MDEQIPVNVTCKILPSVVKLSIEIDQANKERGQAFIQYFLSQQEQYEAEIVQIITARVEASMAKYGLKAISKRIS